MNENLVQYAVAVCALNFSPNCIVMHAWYCSRSTSSGACRIERRTKSFLAAKAMIPTKNEQGRERATY